MCYKNSNFMLWMVLLFPLLYRKYEIEGQCNHSLNYDIAFYCRIITLCYIKTRYFTRNLILVLTLFPEDFIN